MILGTVRKKVKVLVVILGCFLCAGEAFAEQTRISAPEYGFYQGAGFYGAGKYDETIHEYARLLQQGWESGSIYYNLGNCYFKKGELGKALLYYERARRMMPRDEDLQHNYQYVQTLLTIDISPRTGNWYTSTAEKIVSQFSLNDLIFSFTVLFWLLILMVLFRRYIPLSRRYIVILGGIIILLASLSGFGTYERWVKLGKEAIVVVEKAEVKFEPFDRATAHFNLFEGMKVQIRDRKDAWVKVERFDKKAGWVKGTSIETI